jgi:hypothetical protein
MVERMAAAPRALKKWILIPKSDTRDQFIERIAYSLVHTAAGDWDALGRTEPEAIGRRQQWRVRASLLLSALLTAALPMFAWWGVQLTPLALQGAVATYMTIGTFIWAVLTLVVTLNASVQAKITLLKDVMESLPVLGTWLGNTKNS